MICLSSQLEVLPFQSSQAPLWNEFVAQSRNGTFLFNRGYMDYHSDRFQDCSLLVQREGQVVALLPANRRDEQLISHGGLSYGGLVTGASMTTPLMLDCFNACLAWMSDAGISKWHYKTVPSIYHSHPAEDDRYALFRAGASLVRRDVLSVLDPGDYPPFQERRRRGARKATNSGLRAIHSDNWAGFWEVLNARLSDRYETRAVHSLSEMSLLAARFPEQIRLYCVAGPSGDVLAGTVIYDTGRVAHAQYIAGCDEGLKAGALDLLFSDLISRYCAKRRWFDFGVSNERQGRYLNVGLIEFKEGFGARAVCHDYYELSVEAARGFLQNWRSQ